MLTIDEKTTYKKNPGFVSRNIAGELVLIPVQKELRDINCIYSMNALGLEIWNHLDESMTLAQLESSLLEEYDVEPKQLSQDLEEVLGQLRNIKAIIPQ